MSETTATIVGGIVVAIFLGAIIVGISFAIKGIKKGTKKMGQKIAKTQENIKIKNQEKKDITNYLD